MPEGNSALCQIIGGELEGDFVARQNSNAVSTQTPGQMGQYDSLVFQLNAEQTAGKLFEHGALDFNAIFFTHSTSMTMVLASILLYLKPCRNEEKDELREADGYATSHILPHPGARRICGTMRRPPANSLQQR